MDTNWVTGNGSMCPWLVRVRCAYCAMLQVVLGKDTRRARFWGGGGESRVRYFFAAFVLYYYLFVLFYLINHLVMGGIAVAGTVLRLRFLGWGAASWMLFGGEGSRARSCGWAKRAVRVEFVNWWCCREVYSPISRFQQNAIVIMSPYKVVTHSVQLLWYQGSSINKCGKTAWKLGHSYAYSSTSNLAYRQWTETKINTHIITSYRIFAHF